MCCAYLEDGDQEVHAFTVNLALNSSDLVEDNSALTSIYDEEESWEDNTSEKHGTTCLAYTIEKSLHILVDIKSNYILFSSLKLIISLNRDSNSFNYSFLYYEFYTMLRDLN